MPVPAFGPPVKRIAYRCEVCGRKLKEFLLHEKRLGKPELICPKCSVHMPCAHQAEWEDMTGKERRGVVIGHVLATVFAGGALGILAGAVAAAALYLLGAGDAAATVILLSMIAMGILAYALRGIMSVVNSKKRTKGRIL